MNKMFQFFMKIVIVFNIVSLYECRFNKNVFNVIECNGNKLSILNKTQFLKNNGKEQISPTSHEATIFPNLDRKLKKMSSSVSSSSNTSRSKSKLHYDLDLFKSIQIGIQETLNLLEENPTSVPIQYEQNFGFIDIYETAFLGDKNEIQFKAYAPENFSNLRILFKVSNDFKESFTSSYLYVMESKNNSANKILYTADNKFVIKFICEGEQQFLGSLLPSYFTHFCVNNESLLPRILGLYKIKYKSSVYFITVSTNVYPHKLIKENNERYYLKGTDKEALIRDDIIERKFRLLDNNFTEIYDYGLMIPNDLHKKLTRILEIDGKFLKEFNVVNYYLLLVVVTSDNPVLDTNSDENYTNILKAQSRYGETEKTIYYGIENMLQLYTIPKRFENILKNFCCGLGNKVTVQDPKKYLRRFSDFITKDVFVSINDK